jgi:tetratricopeptide (TPR) repeat protein
MGEKDLSETIKELASEDGKIRGEAIEALEVLKDPAQITKNADRLTFLEDTNKHWVACKQAAEKLRKSGSANDKNALKWLAHLLFQSAKELSYVGDETNVDIRRQEIKAYDRVVEINPDHGSCLNNQGITYMQLEEWEPAVDCFRLAVKAKPGYMVDMPDQSSYYEIQRNKAKANLAKSLWNLKQFEEALEMIEEAAAGDSEHAGVRDYMKQHMPYRHFTLS